MEKKKKKKWKWEHCYWYHRSREHHKRLKVKVKVAQSCPTLCDPMDYTVHGILQARILEWVAYPFSSGSSRLRNRTRVSCIAGRFFINWAIREALKKIIMNKLGSLEEMDKSLETCNLPVLNHEEIKNPNRWITIKETESVLVIQSCPTLQTPWTVAHQALLSTEFSR